MWVHFRKVPFLKVPFDLWRSSIWSTCSSPTSNLLWSQVETFSPSDCPPRDLRCKMGSINNFPKNPGKKLTDLVFQLQYLSWLSWLTPTKHLPKVSALLKGGIQKKPHLTKPSQKFVRRPIQQNGRPRSVAAHPSVLFPKVRPPRHNNLGRIRQGHEHHKPPRSLGVFCVGWLVGWFNTVFGPQQNNLEQQREHLPEFGFVLDGVLTESNESENKKKSLWTFCS